MKLKEWAEKTGVKYLTAYRWFKAGTLPVKAYQTESGTIIVEEEREHEREEKQVMNNTAMSMFVKKTVELSNADATIEDFASWVLSNFSLKLNSVSDEPKYSRVKPKPEDVQNHFKQFLKPKGDKPKPNMFVAPAEAIDDLVAKADDLTQKELVEEIRRIGAEAAEVSIVPGDVPEVQDLMKDLSVALAPSGNALFQSSLLQNSSVKLYGQGVEGVVTRSVDNTPQLNYTGSTNAALGNNFCNPTAVTGDIGGDSSFSISNSNYVPPTSTAMFVASSSGATGAFKPTQKELESARTFEKPRRGRKSHKKLGSL